LLEFDPNGNDIFLILVVAMTDYPITKYQPRYFVAQSFKDAQQQVRSYAKSREGLGLNLRYDPLTGTIREMWQEEERVRLVDQLQKDLQLLK
jgi:phenylalanine-4-hydroxylase